MQGNSFTAEVPIYVGLDILSMASTKFYLDCRRVKPGQPAIMKIAIGHGNKTSYVSLDAKLLPEQWEDGRVINHPEKFVLTAYLNEMKQKLDSHIIWLTREQKLAGMTASDIRDSFLIEVDPEKKKNKEDQSSFLYRFNKYAARMSEGSKRTYDHTLNRLTAFTSLPGKISLDKLKFEDITVEWLSDFDKFMAETAKSKNSRNIHFRNIRTVFNDAIEDTITQHYPFRRFKIKNEVTAKRDLSVEELRQLIYFECEEHAKKYRDYFLLMFYLMGINNVDLCNLKEIVKGRIEFHRTKTNHFFSMKVEPEAMALIEKYGGENYLLDILDHWDSDVFFRKKMNKTLQKIGPVTRSGLGGKKKYAPLFPKLTTYYARHSWASIASSLDIPVETISAGLGHEYGNKITAIYINYDNRKVDIANRKVIDWVLYGKIDGKVKVKPGTPKFFGLTQKEAEQLGLLRMVPEKKKKDRANKKTILKPEKEKSSKVA